MALFYAIKSEVAEKVGEYSYRWFYLGSFISTYNRGMDKGVEI